MDARHALNGIEFDAACLRFRSVCTCGWRSRSLSTAGMAGAAVDQHAEAETIIRVLAHGTFG